MGIMSGAGGAGAGASGGEAGAWTVRMSESASRTFNPIRQTLANIKFPPKDVELLKLSIGTVLCLARPRVFRVAVIRGHLAD